MVVVSRLRRPSCRDRVLSLPAERRGVGSASSAWSASVRRSRLESKPLVILLFTTLVFFARSCDLCVAAQGADFQQDTPTSSHHHDSHTHPTVPHRMSGTRPPGALVFFFSFAAAQPWRYAHPSDRASLGVVHGGLLDHTQYFMHTHTASLTHSSARSSLPWDAFAHRPPKQTTAAAQGRQHTHTHDDEIGRAPDPSPLNHDACRQRSLLLRPALGFVHTISLRAECART
jgi:hypothetical protein